MSTITEKINSIVEKIEKNLSSERLGRGKVEDLFYEIKSDLETLGKDTEKEYKETVDKKIEELQKIIATNLKEGPGWTTTQDDLSKIKKGLVELQDEIKRVETSLQVPGTSRETMRVIKASENIQEMVTTYVKAGTDASSIPILKEIGGLVAVGVAGYHGTLVAGVGVAEKLTDDGVELALKGMDVGANVYENTRKGVEEVTKKVIDEGADITKQIVKNFDVLDAGKNITDSLTDAGKNITDSITRGIGQEVKAKADSDARIAEADAKAKAEIARANADAEIAKAQAQAEIMKAQVELAKLNLNK